MCIFKITYNLILYATDIKAILLSGQHAAHFDLKSATTLKLFLTVKFNHTFIPLDILI